jgi:hypothetical protein
VVEIPNFWKAEYCLLYDKLNVKVPAADKMKKAPQKSFLCVSFRMLNEKWSKKPFSLNMFCEEIYVN